MSIYIQKNFPVAKCTQSFHSNEINKESKWTPNQLEPCHTMKNLCLIQVIIIIIIILVLINFGSVRFHHSEIFLYLLCVYKINAILIFQQNFATSRRFYNYYNCHTSKIGICEF